MRKFLILFAAGVLASAFAVADDDPPSRAARLSYVAGTVSFQPQGEETDWVPADLNRALTTGDKVWVEQGGRTEIQTANSVVRLNGHTNFSFLGVEGDTTQIQLSLGVMLVKLNSLGDNETYEVDTPQAAFTLLRPGVYRVEVNEAGDTSVITVRGGDGETTADGKAAPLHVNEQVVIKGSPATYDKHGAPNPDEFDDWANNRDQAANNSVSVSKVAPGVVGAADLDVNGSWRPAPVYGNVWFPNAVVADWAPYRFGHWGFVAPWGWTWIDDAPWGFAPFHYGRWVMVGGTWGWAPGPVALTAIYAPALVSFIGGIDVVGVADPVSWVALSWGEPWYPSFGVSWGYYNSVNLCGTVFAAGIIAGVWGGAAVNLSFGHNPAAVNTVGRGGFAGGHPVGREFAHRGAYGGHAFDHAGASRAGDRHIGATREGRLGGRAPLRAGSRGIPPRGAMGRSAVTRHSPGAGAHGNFRGAGVNARHGASANGGHAGAFHDAANRGHEGGADKGHAGGADRGRAGGADKGRAGGNSASRGGGSAAKGGSSAARGNSASRGGSSAAKGGSSAARGGSSAARGGTSAARGGSSAARGGSSAARGGSTPARGGSSAARGGSTPARGGSSAARGGAPAARGSAPAARSGGGARAGAPAGGGARAGGARAGAPAGGGARGGAAPHAAAPRPSIPKKK